jgi:hypothetical protein
VAASQENAEAVIFRAPVLYDGLEIAYNLSERDILSRVEQEPIPKHRKMVTA